MTQDELKRQAAEAAMQYVENGMIVGVGTGSTVNHFIDFLAERRFDIDGALSSSKATEERLRAANIPVLELNNTGPIPLYVDGADEADPHLRLIKGGGAALTREKICAEAAEKFVCIADASKQVDILGQFPLPVEVIPMARSLVGRELAKLGGQPEWRKDCVTDNGNLILDIHGLQITDPLTLENQINQIPGVVCVGLFARRKADVLIIGSDAGPQITR